MKKKYRQVRYRLHDYYNGKAVVKWQYQIEYSYFGILWCSRGPGFDSEPEADSYYKEYLEVGDLVKYYK